MRDGVARFLDFAREHPELRFLVTGDRLRDRRLHARAGRAAVPRGAPENVVLPERFLRRLTER